MMTTKSTKPFMVIWCAGAGEMLPNYGDYLVFVDESGDHGLLSIDTNFPVFVLVFVIINKQDYLEKIIPAFTKLKLDYFGHEHVILHERDIRRRANIFEYFMENVIQQHHFLEEMNALIDAAEFEYIYAIIDKHKLKSKYNDPYNPYEIALRFCLEYLHKHLERKNQNNKQINVSVESRGKKEDGELELEFRRICDNQKSWGYRKIDFSTINYDICFADKKTNSIGLQIADLIARPLGLRYLKPTQKNRAYEIISNKCKGSKWFP
jgi:hypothetical protein